MSAHLTPFSIFKLPPAPGERSHPFCCFSFSEANLCQSAHILNYDPYSIIHNYTYLKQANVYAVLATSTTMCIVKTLYIQTLFYSGHTPQHILKYIQRSHPRLLVLPAAVLPSFSAHIVPAKPALTHALFFVHFVVCTMHMRMSFLSS